MTTQDGGPELNPNVRDIDYSRGHITMLLTAQTNTITIRADREDQKQWVQRTAWHQQGANRPTRDKQISMVGPCLYCEEIYHTPQQCWWRKSDEDLKDKVNTVILSWQRIYEAHKDPSKKRRNDEVNPTYPQGMTIGGNKKLMNTNRHHQGEKMKSKESAYVRKEPRNLQSRGRVTRPQPTIKIAKSMTITNIIRSRLPRAWRLPRSKSSRRTINLRLQSRLPRAWRLPRSSYQDERSTYYYDRDCQELTNIKMKDPLHLTTVRTCTLNTH